MVQPKLSLTKKIVTEIKSLQIRDGMALQWLNGNTCLYPKPHIFLTLKIDSYPLTVLVLKVTDLTLLYTQVVRTLLSTSPLQVSVLI